MVNALEETIRTVHASLLKSHAEFCSCERCQDDVITLALNQTKPRYVVGDPLGAAVTRVSLSQDAARAEIAVIVFDAMRRIAQSPRHTGMYPRFDASKSGKAAPG